MSRLRQDKEFLSAIVRKLKQFRHERGVSQQVVTMDTGINIGRVESGKRSLSILTLGLLCRYYGITLEVFFQDVDTPAAPWET